MAVSWGDRSLWWFVNKEDEPSCRKSLKETGDWENRLNHLVVAFSEGKSSRTRNFCQQHRPLSVQCTLVYLTWAMHINGLITISPPTFPSCIHACRCHKYSARHTGNQYYSSFFFPERHWQEFTSVMTSQDGRGLRVPFVWNPAAVLGRGAPLARCSLQEP